MAIQRRARWFLVMVTALADRPHHGDLVGPSRPVDQASWPGLPRAGRTAPLRPIRLARLLWVIGMRKNSWRRDYPGGEVDLALYSSRGCYCFPFFGFSVGVENKSAPVLKNGKS
jgi:hypothetical protein